jgi:exodeoxyribonuclease VII large subunit
VRLAVGGAALETAARARLEDARRRLGLAAASLDAMSPLAVLARGYALAQDERGRVLRSARGVSAGDAVRVRLSEGSLRCRVEEAEGN